MSAAETATSGTGANPAPYLITVAFDVDPVQREHFVRLVTSNAQASLRDEPGCLRFDVLLPVSTGECDVLLYEIYRDRAAFDAHLASAHFLSFDAATRDAVRRKTVREYHLLPPTPDQPVPQDGAETAAPAAP
jgi:(4S)-4-hydroxy-5-phosphonooxypentane-2,3-dione isomerase